MSAYHIHPVDGLCAAEMLHYLNGQEPGRFPALELRHLEHGHWWFARTAHRDIVGFAGMTPMVPFPGVGYMKRAYVSPEHRGNGLQYQFMVMREAKARELGWHMLVGECARNQFSERNFARAGFLRCEPEQCWGESGSVYFVKSL